MKNRIQKSGALFFVIFAAIIFSGCATKNVAGTGINLAPGTRATLPPPATNPPLHREQLLAATAGGSTHTLHVVLDADAVGVTLVGLSPLGIRLFKATYDTAGIVTQQLAPLGEMPPASQVLGDILFAYRPVSAWKNHLPENWTLLDDNAGLRTLRDNAGKIIIEIDYEKQNDAREPVRIRQHAFGYEIKITNLD